jgi:hypothetical protein
MSIADMRAGLAKNMRDNIPGLRVSETIPDQPNPPMAVISLESVNHDQTFQRGMAEYNFTISVFRVECRNVTHNVCLIRILILALPQSKRRWSRIKASGEKCLMFASLRCQTSVR